MNNNRIAYAERVARVADGLSSDREGAALILSEFAQTPLVDFFDHDWTRITIAVEPFVGEGIRSGSTLGEAAVAIDQEWHRGEEGRPELISSIVALASVLGAENPFKGDDAACFEQLGQFDQPLENRDDSRRRPSAVALASRIDSLGSARVHAARKVAKMQYAAYLDAVDAATGKACMGFRKSHLEGRWNAKRGMTLETIVTHAIKYKDEPSSLWLLDNFVIKPFADIHESIAGSASRSAKDDEGLGSNAVLPDCTLEDLGLAREAYSALGRIGIYSMADLLVHAPSDLLQRGGVGLRCLETIESKLSERGMELAVRSRFDLPMAAEDMPSHESAREAIAAFVGLPMSFLLQKDTAALDKLEECAANRMIDLSTFGACVRAISEMRRSSFSADQSKAREMLGWLTTPFKAHRGHCPDQPDPAGDSALLVSGDPAGAQFDEDLLLYYFDLEGPDESIACLSEILSMPRGLFRSVCDEAELDACGVVEEDVELRLEGLLRQIDVDQIQMAQMYAFVNSVAKGEDLDRLLFRELVGPFVCLVGDFE